MRNAIMRQYSVKPNARASGRVAVRPEVTACDPLFHASSCCCCRGTRCPSRLRKPLPSTRQGGAAGSDRPTASLIGSCLWCEGKQMGVRRCGLGRWLVGCVRLVATTTVSGTRAALHKAYHPSL